MKHILYTFVQHCIFESFFYNSSGLKCTTVTIVSKLIHKHGHVILYMSNKGMYFSNVCTVDAILLHQCLQFFDWPVEVIRQMINCHRREAYNMRFMV